MIITIAVIVASFSLLSALALCVAAKQADQRIKNIWQNRRDTIGSDQYSEENQDENRN